MQVERTEFNQGGKFWVKDAKTKQIRLKKESRKRIKAFSEAHSTTEVQIIKMCLKAYLKRLPNLKERHVLNPFRSKTHVFQLYNVNLPKDIDGDSFMINQIILWWTDKNGKYPKENGFKPTEKFIIETETEEEI